MSPFTRAPLLGLAVTFWTLLLTAATGLTQTPPLEDARPVEKSARNATAPVANPALPTIWLIGDSTVKVGTGGQRGWGEEFAGYFDLSKVNVVNRAIGGRSSRTFITEGRWNDILGQLKKGDVVIMQFGHNDGGAVNDDSRARGSLRGVGEESQEIDNLLTKKHETVRSYGWYMRSYIQGTQAHGATPVVCSLIPRKVWKEGRIERAAESYGGWAQAVATQEGALFVDLNDIVATRYEKLGEAAVEPFFADARTHTTVAGARFNAESVIAGLKALPQNPVASYLSAPAATVLPWPQTVTAATAAH